MAEATPMMRQYKKIKAENPGTLLFFRLGDFYEMFGEDAKIASKELDLTLTTRDRSKPSEEQTPMCGVPYHACQGYIARLISKGYKVAICEQTEDPALAKGLVERSVTRIVTPGTVMEQDLISDDRNNYIAGVYAGENACGVCFCDITTGEMRVSVFTGFDAGEQAMNELYSAAPVECVLAGTDTGDIEKFLKDKLDCPAETKYAPLFAESVAQTVLAEQFGEINLEDLSAGERPFAEAAAGGLLGYLREMQKGSLNQIRRLTVKKKGVYMEIDMTARRNLELTRSMRSGDTKGTLLGTIDRTKTAMGHRMLRSQLEKPLMDLEAIMARHEAVEELAGKSVEREELRKTLGAVYDIERLMGRMIYGNANARDLIALAQTCEKLPQVAQFLGEMESSLLREMSGRFDTLSDIGSSITAAIEPDPPVSVRDGGMIAAGFSAEVDRLRDIIEHGTERIAELEAREREKTGIKTLRVGYNRVFGYFLEVSKSYFDLVPEGYVRKQTLANRERYITQELKELESDMLGAKDRIKDTEYRLFCVLRDDVARQVDRVQQTAADIAMLDMLCSFGHSAVKYRYVRPRMSGGTELNITAGRHPVVEMNLPDKGFVPNDTFMNTGDDRVMIITGPNMAGKSTYMRQVALIVIMAQIGSFVPASGAEIGIVDRVFTRVGASDDLAGGRSTFMVEMTEVAEILQNATFRSLILLDEIGRGTSTYDGMSVARAVVERCWDRDKLGARTLFATHYHELTVLQEELPGVKNYHISAIKRGEKILFLRKIEQGGADESYGIEVAQLAGVPGDVISRAKEILAKLECGQMEIVVPRERKHEPTEQEQRAAEIFYRIQGLNLNFMTPIQAMETLYELHSLASDEPVIK